MKTMNPTNSTKAAHDLIPLRLLRAGERGRVGAVLGAGELAHRLREMGLRQGAEVQMVRPGSPCIIRLSGHKLCFRADDATSVLVSTGMGVAVPC